LKFQLRMNNIPSILSHAILTPWKIWNTIYTWITFPRAYLSFRLNGIEWGKGWRIIGVPIIQKHRQSIIRIGPGLSLRSSVRSNPLGVNHPVILCTWQAGAILEIGANFSMTGGSIVAAERITIGDNVTVGANTNILDTDFHPLDPIQRHLNPQVAKTARVVIEDDVFIGMNCLVLKGVTIGHEAVIGAGSVVTKDVPAKSVFAGNPGRVIGKV
jgi:acetyltransferase-like isoleucine patch superfamily enzyme